MEYGLKRRRLDRAIISARIREAVSLLRIEEFLDRYPSQLSGGQAQVSQYARALVRDPAVLLMDEPLSSLDAQLRTHARSEMKRLQAETGTTTVYVTHDQVEAMTMGNRIAVMSVRTCPVCTRRVYRRPATTFVAGFIGSPAMNLIQTDIASARGWRVGIGDQVAILVNPPERPRTQVGRSKPCKLLA